MQLFPAIDLRGGRCVRLYRGDFDAETVYADDPAAVAASFAAAGATWLHVVDLDAARTGELANLEHVGAIVAAAGVPVQYGGGVRSVAAAARLAEAGVARVVIGTAALETPELVAEVSARQPVALGLDVRVVRSQCGVGVPAAAGWLSKCWPTCRPSRPSWSRRSRPTAPWRGPI